MPEISSLLPSLSPASRARARRTLPSRLRGRALLRSAGADGSATPATHRSLTRRVFLGRAEDPRWARPMLWVLLVVAAVLYLVDLSSSGNANDFYAAAVKSGTESWQAWLFGSLDSANAITVDKPPASLWLMVLSARLFGFSSFSMLLPQALMGVATVGVTYAAVRRWSGHLAGLVAGALVTLTPVAALMFRFNNPDALLVLLMTLAAYCVVRAVDAGRSVPADRPDRPTRRSRALRWMLLAGTAIGFAFLTKMAQGMLVLPAFGLVYLLASPLRLRARIGHLLAAAAALVVSAGWFVVLVELWPAAARPYIGGSTNNSLWELALGYNGLGRILGGSGGSGGGSDGGGGGFGGTAGITRLFNSAFGGEVSWLLPAALLALLGGLWVTRRAPRSNRTRAALVLWGAWLVVSGLVFSFMTGTVHPYYAVALVPALGALVAVGGTLMWRLRERWLPRVTLAAMIAGTAGRGWYLMGRDADGWMSWLRWTMLVGGLLGAVGLAVSTGALKRFAVAAVLVGSVAATLGTAGWTVATVASGHTGSTPSAGPAVAASSGFGGAGGGLGGERPSGPSASQTERGASSAPPSGMPQGGFRPGGSSTDSAVVALLDATSSRWSAAVVGDQSAAGYILSTDTAVMAIGGWSGSDPSLTLAQFQRYVQEGDISYFIAGGQQMGRGGDSSSVASEITSWVQANYTASTVGGVTVYDLTS